LENILLGEKREDCGFFENHRKIHIGHTLPVIVTHRYRQGHVHLKPWLAEYKNDDTVFIYIAKIIRVLPVGPTSYFRGEKK